MNSSFTRLGSPHNGMVREPDPPPRSPTASATDSVSGDSASDDAAPNDATSVALDWLRSEQASRVAARYLRSRALPSVDDLIDDVLADTCVAILERQARGQFDPENPEAYATTMLRNRITKLNRPPTNIADPDEVADQSDPDPVYEFLSDDVRVLIENRRLRPAITSAMLSYLTFLMHPDAIPVDAPQPVSGARPDQARAWPALWMAGERELFSESSSGALRRRRARRISEVLEHMGAVLAHAKAERNGAGRQREGNRVAGRENDGG